MWSAPRRFPSVPPLVMFVMMGALFSALGESRSVPFELHRGLIFAEVRCASGQPLSFVLDTGSEKTLLDKRAAERLGLELRPERSVLGVNGTLSAWRSGQANLMLGGGHKMAESFLVLDLARHSRTIGRRIDGLIGADFLAHRAIRIDFEKKRLVVAPKWAPQGESETLPLERRDGVLCVRLVANGETLPRVRVDTGSIRSLCWSPPPGARETGPWFGDRKRRAAEVRLGNRIVSRVQSEVLRRPLFPGEDGLLGNGFLSQYSAVWIDAPGGRLAIER